MTSHFLFLIFKLYFFLFSWFFISIFTLWIFQLRNFDFVSNIYKTFWANLEMLIMNLQKLFDLVFLKFKEIWDFEVSKCRFFKLKFHLLPVNWAKMLSNSFKAFHHKFSWLNQIFRSKFYMFIIFFYINQIIKLKIGPICIIYLNWVNGT